MISSKKVLGTFEDILNAALSLPPEARAMLVDRLVRSFDEPNQEEIDAAWAKEAERRSRDLDEGRLEAIDGELVLQRLRSRYKLGKDERR